MRALVGQHRWLFSTLDIGEATHVILHPRCPATIAAEAHSYPLQPSHKKENFFIPSVGKLIPLTPLPLLHLSVRTQST